MKTKMNFSDIANVIERDEMRGIVGGYRSVERPQDMAYEFSAGAAGGESKLPSFAPGRGGKYGLGVGNTYSSMTTKFGCETNSYYSKSTSDSYYTNNPAEIRQIMAALTGNTYSYDPKVVYDNGQVKLGGITIYTHNKSNSDSAAQTLGAVAFGWDTKTMLSQLAAGGDAAGDLAGYFKYLEGVGVVGLAAGAGMTLSDAYDKGRLTDYHVADLGTNALIYGIGTAIPVAGWTLGAAYFFANYYCEKTYGEGLYEHLSGN